MTPFPSYALPVLKIIRKEVHRPKEMPGILKIGSESYLRWLIDEKYFCPMGLCPNATASAPADGHFFRYPVRDHAISQFAHWFDSQTDARAVMDFIWPKKGKK